MVKARNREFDAHVNARRGDNESGRDELIPQIAWVGMAIILLLIIANVDGRLGGWLLIVVVMGMIYAAHTRKDASGNPLI